MEETRFVAAHEVGHIALWHPNQVNNCLKGNWLYDRQEIEVFTIAASILVPAGAVSSGVIDERGEAG